MINIKEHKDTIIDLYFNQMYNYSQIIAYFNNKYSYAEIKQVISNYYATK